MRSSGKLRSSGNPRGGALPKPSEPGSSATLPQVPPDCVRLYLCRHGESEANEAHLLCGSQLDSCLSPKGQEQAQELANALARLPVQRVVSSPLARARETAAPVAKALALPSPLCPKAADDDTIRKDLSEMNYGDLEGLCMQEATVRARMKKLWASWQADPSFPCPGTGGESMSALAERGQRALLELAKHSSESRISHVVVVAHSMLLRATIASFLLAAKSGSHSPTCEHLSGATGSRCTIPLLSVMQRTQLPNCSVSVVDCCFPFETAAACNVRCVGAPCTSFSSTAASSNDRNDPTFSPTFPAAKPGAPAVPGSSSSEAGASPGSSSSEAGASPSASASSL
eukprot:INCI6302.1.p1 GENE.INCI6302.1~~INCI6302.1.p1  ORF type:complete len:343 (+),score=43.74 INCI6302.1:171-1199(+)